MGRTTQTDHPLLGRNPDTLSVGERASLAGLWVALREYQPDNLALRRIAACEATPEACREALHRRGEDPTLFQYVLMRGL
jgi:hypothetical protein